jgi:hypothetical protein
LREHRSRAAAEVDDGGGIERRDDHPRDRGRADRGMRIDASVVVAVVDVIPAYADRDDIPDLDLRRAKGRILDDARLQNVRRTTGSTSLDRTWRFSSR